MLPHNAARRRRAAHASAPLPPDSNIDQRGLPLIPSPLALVNTIIAAPCSRGLRVNTVAVKGHHAPSKDDGSLKWALSVAAIFHLTGPTHEGGLVAPSSWATGHWGWGKGDERGCMVGGGGGLIARKEGRLYASRGGFGILT